MINFSQRDDVISSTLILLSIVILALTLIFMLAVPKPTMANATRGEKTIRRHMYGDIADAKARGVRTRASIAPMLWTGTTDTVSAAILAQLTAQCSDHQLKLGAFRPQRGSVLAGITDLPFNVQISGSYDSVRAVMEALDDANTKLVLRSVQIAASEEQQSNQVTATLGLSAYIVNDPDIMADAQPTKGAGHA